ncbi:MAG: energy-coupling factor transporter ATP-binding protein EcfA2 [Pirellulaceae bacterium]|jgi:energy-coupling factor transporter ATP-binding protein EcfA2
MRWIAGVGLVRLVNLRVDGLGAEHTRTLEFGDGVNVVYGASGSGKTAISQLLKSLISGDSTARFSPNLSCSADLTYDEGALKKSIHYRFNGSTASTDGNYPTTTHDTNLAPVFFMGGCPVGQVSTLLETAYQLGFPAVDANPLPISLDDLLDEREQLRSHLATLPIVDSVDALQQRRIELEDKLAASRHEIERIHIRRDRHLDEIRGRIESIRSKHDEAKRALDTASMELDDYQRLLEEHTLRRRRERLEFVESRRDALQRVDLQLLQLMEFSQQLNRQRNELYHNSSELYSVLQPLQLSSCERTQLDNCLREVETMIHGVERKRQQLALELQRAEASDDTYVADDSIVCGVCLGSNEKCQSVQTSSSHWEVPKWRGSDVRYSEEHLNNLQDRHRSAKRLFDELDIQLTKWKAEYARNEELDELRRLEQQSADYHNELEATKSLIDIARQRAQVETRIRTIVEQIEAAKSTEAFLHVLARASELLHDISDRSFDDITVHSRKTISVRTENGRKAWSELACGTQSLIYFCMSVALAENLRATGLRFPLVLDDLFIQIDSDRDRATANLINKIAADSQQVIVLTRHRHVPQLFDQPGTQHLGLSELAPVVIQHAPEPEPVVESPVHEKTRKNSLQETMKVWEESLHVDAMPSITSEGRDLLATLHVETLRDLIDLDVDSDNINWNACGLEQDRVRRWQSHANLLCFVPNLRGSDAVLLTACGVRCPASLCEFEPAELDRRIRKFFNAGVRSSVEATRRPSIDRLADWIKWTNRRQSRWTRRCKQRSQRPTTMRTGILTINRDADSSYASNPGESAGNSNRANSNRDNSNRDNSNRDNSNRGSSTRGSSSKTRSSGSRSSRTRRSRSQSTGDGDADRGSSRRDRSRSESGQRESGQRDGEDRDSRGEDVTLRFFLELSSPIVDAPTIGAKTAERLEEIGVYSVQDLLNVDADELAERLNNRRMNADTIRQWQAEATLVCRVPQLRGHDAQILVACDLTDVDTVAEMEPNSLWGLVQPLIDSKKGQRIIRNGKVPDLDEIRGWIASAQQARSLRAA